MTRKKSLKAFLYGSLLLLGIVPSSGQSLRPAPSPLPLYKQQNAPLERRVQDLVRRMATEEKARQLDMYAGVDFVDKHTDGTHMAPDAQFQTAAASKAWGSLGVGSIHDLYPSASLANTIQRWVISHNRFGIPAIFIEEGLHGYSGHGQTVYPQSINLASTWNPDMARATGAAIASEARANGVDMILGPVLDVAREPRWGRVEEDFGEDPYLTGALGTAYVQGMQGESLATDHTVIAEPKHFAGHGSPEGGLNTAPVHAGEREMRTTMLRSFEPVFRQGHAMGVMAAYHEVDGIPCTDNPWLLTKVLRQEWGFQGFVLSDLGAIRMLYDTHHVAATPGDAVRAALRSGVDMQFYDFDHDTYQSAIVGGVRSGTLSPTVLDQAISRVLRAKFALGLFDHPNTDPSQDARVRRSQAHLDLALESARQSLCLLKNEQNLLPLPKNLKTIAVIGPNAAVARLGDYASTGEDQFPSLLDGLKARVSPQTRVLFDDGSNLEAAVAKARGADVAILGLGERQGISGEGFDRSDLNLPGNQELLLEAVAATGVPVVLVLQNGRPLTIPWAAAHIPAILEAWYPGERGGQAIAETLLGDNNPAGRLPISFPRTVGALPDFYNHDPSKHSSYVDGDAAPLFLFGYGLSYTTFRYDTLTAVPTGTEKTPAVTVSVAVTNTGNRAGDEVVQLYLHPNTSSVETPSRALKGFHRIHLEPSETRTVTFHLTPYELEVWNTQGKWVVENGVYTVAVGGSSEGGLTTQFSLSPALTAGKSGAFDLTPETAALHGTEIRVAEEQGQVFIGYWDKAAEDAYWTVRVPKKATYRVTADYSTGNGPTAFEVAIAGKTLVGTTGGSSAWTDYRRLSLGTIALPPGRYIVTVRSHDRANWKGINIRSILLQPAPVE
jgi:beta-glucosidase